MPSSSRSKRSIEPSTIDNNSNLEVKDQSSTLKKPKTKPSLIFNKQRDQRMFGVLLNTLTKFKTESQEDKKIDENRLQINKRLQEKLLKENQQLTEQLEKEKQERIEKARLFKEQFRQKRLKELKPIIQEHYSNLMNFLYTKSEPRIYYVLNKPLDELDQKIKMQKEQWNKELQKQLDEEVKVDKYERKKEEENNNNKDEHNEHTKEAKPGNNLEQDYTNNKTPENEETPRDDNSNIITKETETNKEDSSMTK